MTWRSCRTISTIAGSLLLTFLPTGSRALEAPDHVRAPALAAVRTREVLGSLRAQAEQARAALDRAILEVAYRRSLESDARERLGASRGGLASLERRCAEAAGLITARREAVAASMLGALRRARRPSSRERVGISHRAAGQLVELWRADESSLASLRVSIERATGEMASAVERLERAAALTGFAEQDLATGHARLLDRALELDEAERRHVLTSAHGARSGRGPAERAPSGSLPETVASLEVIGGARAGRPDPGPSFRLPVEGSVTRRFGERRGDQRVRGVVLRSDHSQAVLAPGRGRVAYAGPFLGLGLLLIIEHGDDYHSLVIGASRLDIGRGEPVVEGQIVGWLEGGLPEGAELYLELRRVGEPVDPLQVLSAREGEVQG